MTQHTDRDEHRRPAHETTEQAARTPPLQAPRQPAPPVSHRERDGLAGRRLLLA